MFLLRKNFFAYRHASHVKCLVIIFLKQEEFVHVVGMFWEKYDVSRNYMFHYNISFKKKFLKLNLSVSV